MKIKNTGETLQSSSLVSHRLLHIPFLHFTKLLSPFAYSETPNFCITSLLTPVVEYPPS